MLKIIKYKIRQYLYRCKVPVKRDFNGRSNVAKVKIRHKGRFIRLNPNQSVL